MSKLTMVELAGAWLRLDDIESVLPDGRDARIMMRSGASYDAPLSVGEVITRLRSAADSGGSGE